MIKFSSLIEKEENEIDEAVNFDCLVDSCRILNEDGNQSAPSTQTAPNMGQPPQGYNPEGIVLGAEEMTTRMSWNARNKDPKYAIRNGTFYNDSANSNSYFVMWYLFGMLTTTDNLIKSLPASSKEITAFEGICPTCVQQLYNWIITENGGKSPYYMDENIPYEFLTVEPHITRIALGTENINPRPILNPDFDQQFCLKNEIFSNTYTGDIQKEDFDIIPMAGACNDFHSSQVDATKKFLLYTAKQKQGFGYIESDQVWNMFYDDDSVGYQNYWDNIITNVIIIDNLQAIDLSLGFDGTCMGIKYNPSEGPNLDDTQIISAMRKIGNIERYKTIVDSEISNEIGFSGGESGEDSPLTRGNLAYWMINTTFSNSQVNGIPQFPQENLHYSDYFATTSNKDLFYSINHYPPPKTGWINNKLLADTLYMTDKERPAMGRINNALNLMGTPNTQKAGKGRVIT